MDFDKLWTYATNDVIIETEVALMDLKNVQAILGGKKNLNISLSNTFDLIVLSKKGVPKKSLKYFLKHTDIRLSDLADMLPISLRSIQRYEESKRFSPEVSQKILQIAKIFIRGREVFGSNEKFISWLKKDNFALSDKKPMDLLANAFGYEIVSDELGRIEYGIFG